MLSKLQERAKAREQRSLTTTKESDIQDTKTSEQSCIGKTKRKLEQQQEKEKKQPKKKKRKESISEQDDVDDSTAEHTGLGPSDRARKKKKKKDKKGSVTCPEEQQHTGAYNASINLSGKRMNSWKLCGYFNRYGLFL